MTSEKDMHLSVASGSGLVGRFGPSVLLVADPSDEDSEDAVQALLDAVEELAGDPGLVWALLSVLTPDTPAFGVLTRLDDGWHVLLRGPALLGVPEEEEESGEHALTWLDLLLPELDGPLSLRLADTDAPEPARHEGLLAGLVPGGAVSISLTGPAQVDEVDVEPDDASSTASGKSEPTPVRKKVAKKAPAKKAARKAPAKKATAKKAAPKKAVATQDESPEGEPTQGEPTQGESQQAAAEQSAAKAVAVEPEDAAAETGPADIETADTEPADTEPAAAEPAAAEPAAAEPAADTEPADADDTDDTDTAAPADTPATIAIPVQAKRSEVGLAPETPTPEPTLEVSEAPASTAEEPESAAPVDEEPAAAEPPPDDASDSGPAWRAAGPPESDPVQVRWQDVGVLVADDGSRTLLDRSYVFGREPYHAAAVQEGGAIPIVVRDPHNQISGVHVHIQVDGGHVMVQDEDSEHGTFVAPPGATEWDRVGVAPTVLHPGWSLRIGHRVFTYRTAAA